MFSEINFHPQLLRRCGLKPDALRAEIQIGSDAAWKNILMFSLCLCASVLKKNYAHCEDHSCIACKIF